jgi:hypothetical protein
MTTIARVLDFSRKLAESRLYVHAVHVRSHVIAILAYEKLRKSAMAKA